jgi:membrane protein implicated in regulation of membrane protease activity
MNVENQAIETMVREIIKTIKTIVNGANFDRTKKGRIVSHIEGKYYEVQLDGQIYKAYSPTFTYKENDIVYVKIAENNYNNLLIECAIK